MWFVRLPPSGWAKEKLWCQGYTSDKIINNGKM
jgi:hypothetical protein